MTTPAGSPGTASDGYRVEKPVGRHRAPPEPPPPPRLLRWLPHVTVLAVVGIVGPPVWLFAVTIGADASAASAAAARDGLAVSTAARPARTVHVPLTVLPVPVPSIGAEGAWDPETTPSSALSRPVPSETFAGATGTATAPQTPSGELVATTTPLTTTRPPTTSTVDTATTTRTTTSPSPTTDAAAATTASATPTEETPVSSEPTAEPTPTDIEDVIDEVLGTEEAP